VTDKRALPAKGLRPGLKAGKEKEGGGFVGRKSVASSCFGLLIRRGGGGEAGRKVRRHLRLFGSAG